MPRAIGDEVVRATASHPFWVENRGAFVPADRLEAGYSLRSDGGALATIGSVTLRRVAETPTWNLIDRLSVAVCDARRPTHGAAQVDHGN